MFLLFFVFACKTDFVVEKYLLKACVITVFIWY